MRATTDTFSLAILAGAVTLATPALAQDAPFQEGAPVPDLRLPTIDGGTVDLAALRGTKVLLIEFASW